MTRFAYSGCAGQGLLPVLLKGLVAGTVSALGVVLSLPLPWAEITLVWHCSWLGLPASCFGGRSHFEEVPAEEGGLGETHPQRNVGTGYAMPAR